MQPRGWWNAWWESSDASRWETRWSETSWSETSRSETSWSETRRPEDILLEFVAKYDRKMGMDPHWINVVHREKRYKELGASFQNYRRSILHKGELLANKNGFSVGGDIGLLQLRHGVIVLALAVRGTSSLGAKPSARMTLSSAMMI